MEPISFGCIGILQIDGKRFGFRPTELYHEYGSSPILKGEFFPEAFAISNIEAKAREYIAGMGKIARDPEIKNVYFNDPATVVIWNDGTKTVVKCQPGDTYSKETGLALCIAKKYLGNKGNFNEVFKKWIPEEVEISVEEMRKALDEFCHTKPLCSECPLENPVCRCGCGTHFLNRNNDRYDMSDDEIRNAYKVAFK